MDDDKLENVSEPEDLTLKNVENTELKIYEDILKRASAINSCQVLPNADEKHAAIAFSILFNNTTTSVNMVVDCFSGEVSNNKKYLKALNDCLDRNVMFKVLCLNPPNEHSLGYKALKSHKKEHPKNVTISLANQEAKQVLELSMNPKYNFGELHNFTLFDFKQYRLEFIPKKYMALISFNDPDFVTKQKVVFDRAFSLSPEIPN